MYQWNSACMLHACIPYIRTYIYSYTHILWTDKVVLHKYTVMGGHVPEARQVACEDLQKPWKARRRDANASMACQVKTCRRSYLSAKRPLPFLAMLLGEARSDGSLRSTPMREKGSQIYTCQRSLQGEESHKGLGLASCEQYCVEDMPSFCRLLQARGSAS